MTLPIEAVSFLLLLFLEIFLQNSLYRLSCAGKPELYKGACQKDRSQRAGAHCAAQEKAEHDKEEVAAHPHPSELHRLDLVRQDHSHQVIGAAAVRPDRRDSPCMKTVDVSVPSSERRKSVTPRWAVISPDSRRARGKSMDHQERNKGTAGCRQDPHGF